MTAALLLAAVALLGLGSTACATARAFRAGFAVQAVGAALLGAVGFSALVSGTTLGSAFTGGFTPRFGVDGLTAFFLGALGLVAAPTFAFASRYLEPSMRNRVIASLTGVFVLVLAEVLCARDPLMFLAGWELMTLLPAVLILIGRSDEAARRAVFLYIAVTHIAGAGTWVAVLLSAHAGLLDGTHVLAPGSGIQIAIALAALAGMGTKAGVMPMHTWLPRAHPIAPAPVSALMSGVMIKVAIYGLIRVLVDWLDVLPVWFGVLVLALGALSAVGGVVYALLPARPQTAARVPLDREHRNHRARPRRMPVAPCARVRHVGGVRARGGVAAYAQSRSVQVAAVPRRRRVRACRRLARDRPARRATATHAVDGGAFLVGSLAIAGVPPLNGFASEWLTLQALVHVPAYGALGDGLAGAFALAALAATAALAVFCFVKVVGLVLLGPPRRAPVADAIETPVPMRAALVALAGACVVLGLVPGLLVASLARLAPWPVSISTSLALHLPGTGSLPTVGVALALGLLASAFAVLRGRRVAAPAPTWVCGQLVQPQLAWTSAGFTKPLRLVLEVVLRPQREIVVRTVGGVVQEVSYSGRVPHLIDERLYAPAVRSALVAARHARRLQTGRLGTYVGYLIALVLVLLAAAKAGVIG